MRFRKKASLWLILVICSVGATLLYRTMLWPDREGLHKQALTKELCYLKHGFVDKGYTGLAADADGVWYVERGRVDETFTGLVKLPLGWYRIENGKWDSAYEGFVEDGLFCWYLSDGQVQFQENGLFYGEVDGEPGWWYVSRGRMVRTDDVVKGSRDWWCVRDGKVRFSYCGIAENANGKWYLSDGRVNFSNNGIVLLRDGTYFLDKGRVLGEVHSDSTRFVAHRGFSAKAPENTKRAFEEAGKAGFWGCETDVWQTADDRFVLSHDPDFERMCGVKASPGEMTADEIRKLRLIDGNGLDEYANDPKATKVAFLDDFLRICLRYNMVPVIEIKEEAAAGSEADYLRLQELYAQTHKRMGDREVVFISFDFESLKIMRQILTENKAANVTLQYLTKDMAHLPIEECEELKIDVDVKQDFVGDYTIASIHERNLEVDIWTVNKAETVYELILDGADYITTNKKFWLNP